MNTLVLFMKDGSIKYLNTSHASITKAYDNIPDSVSKYNILTVKLLDKDGKMIRNI